MMLKANFYITDPLRSSPRRKPLTQITLCNINNTQADIPRVLRLVQLHPGGRYWNRFDFTFFFVLQISGCLGSAKPCLPQSNPVTNRRKSSHLSILVNIVYWSIFRLSLKFFYHWDLIQSLIKCVY